MACSLHRIHRPRNLTTEFHHIIPQAWQLTLDPKLFDRRTIELCPTSHRNVHFWIVKLMMHAQVARTEDPVVAYKAARPAVASREFAIAYQALTRWTAHITTPAPLSMLYDDGELGQA
jgi:hypothetical protein